MKLHMVYYITCIQNLWILMKTVLHLYVFVQYVSISSSKTTYNHYQWQQESILAIIDTCNNLDMPNLHEELIINH